MHSISLKLQLPINCRGIDNFKVPLRTQFSNTLILTHSHTYSSHKHVLQITNRYVCEKVTYRCVEFTTYVFPVTVRHQEVVCHFIPMPLILTCISMGYKVKIIKSIRETILFALLLHFVLI